VTDSTEITPASTDHADAVADLWVDLAVDQRRYGSRLKGTQNRAAIREAIVQRIVTDDLLLARLDGDVVGFVMFTIERGRYEQDGTTGVVENLYVAPDARRRGVGSALLTNAEERLDDAGATVISIEAMAGNDAARAFYASHGYVSHRVELTKPTENDTA
jgi:ribosomal protein S18 acetylase RimI-like enzyme